jgi:hypothetical protein
VRSATNGSLIARTGSTVGIAARSGSIVAVIGRHLARAGPRGSRAASCSWTRPPRP